MVADNAGFVEACLRADQRDIGMGRRVRRLCVVSGQFAASFLVEAYHTRFYSEPK